jgi:hypothetical protein
MVIMIAELPYFFQPFVFQLADFLKETGFNYDLLHASLM